MLPKGQTTTRVRRRQSDAKWRASVAMCYNIMKNVIPNQKKLGRRKVSKALTLKETERHIVNLERKLKEIIEDRAPMSGKMVMVERGDRTMYPATFEDIKKDFALKQHSFFASNNGNGKKRYNIPADIEASLENLSQQSCRLRIVSRAQAKSPSPILPRLFKSAGKKCHLNQHELHHSFLQNLLTSSSNDLLNLDSHDASDLKSGDIVTACQDAILTPCKAVQTCQVPPLQGQTPCQPAVTGEATPTTPTTRVKDPNQSQHTPRGKRGQTGLSSGRTGFTPVKLPSDVECHDVLLSFPTTPAKSGFGSPFSNLSLPETPSSCFNGFNSFEFLDEEPSSSLLCEESIDFEELTRDWSPETSKRSPTLLMRKTAKAESRSDINEQRSPGRRGLKCRRKLAEQYKTDEREEEDHLVPSGEDVLAAQDLNRFLFLYEDDSGLTDTSDCKVPWKDAPFANMLDSLCRYDNDLGCSGIASLDCVQEASDTLTASLVDLDMKSFHKFHDFSSSAEAFQEVPDYSLSVMEKHGYTTDLVPELGDMNCGGDWQNQSADDQVVPEAGAT